MFIANPNQKFNTLLFLLHARRQDEDCRMPPKNLFDSVEGRVPTAEHSYKC